MDGTLNAWWLGLLALFRDRETIDFEPMNTRFRCPDSASKTWGLRRATAWVWQDFRRADQLAPLFAANGISMPRLVEDAFLPADEVRALDAHPLISIAAHTRTHRALGLMDPEDAMNDIAGNKSDLETLLQREVPHFAYPYGPPSITGTREADWLARIGFASAVTTTPGCLFPEHGGSPLLLPRQNAESQQDGPHLAMCGVEGVVRALSTRGGDPVARPARHGHDGSHETSSCPCRASVPAKCRGARGLRRKPCLAPARAFREGERCHLRPGFSWR